MTPRQTEILQLLSDGNWHEWEELPGTRRPIENLGATGLIEYNTGAYRITDKGRAAIAPGNGPGRPRQHPDAASKQWEYRRRKAEKETAELDELHRLLAAAKNLCKAAGYNPAEMSIKDITEVVNFQAKTIIKQDIENTTIDDGIFGFIGNL